MAGKHRKPTKTRKSLARAATGSVAGLAILGLTQPAAADPCTTGGTCTVPESPGPVAPPPAPAPAPAPQAAPPRPAAAPDLVGEHVVVPGDTVSEIARDHTDLCAPPADMATCWQPLYEQNRDVIGDNPDLIFPGQVLHFVGGLVLSNPPQPAGESAPVSVPVPQVELSHAPIANSGGPVQPQTQHAADSVFTNVPGAQLITIGGTGARAGNSDHPGGLALDFMVLDDAALGDAIVAYSVAHWAELGVKYIIWEQRILTSPGGTWEWMEDRGSATANHYDHVHISYN